MLYNEPSPLETKVLTRRFGLPNSASIDTYLATDGYKAFMKAAGMKPEQIIEEMKVSNLRGRGGAGFPTGMKWSFVPRNSPKPKYIVVNADESEPGTCKDRAADGERSAPVDRRRADRRPGGGCACGLHLYPRRVSLPDRDHGQGASPRRTQKGWLGKNIQGTGFDFELYTHTGAGAYECGEESALLESLEGKRGIPRIRPPFPGGSGRVPVPDGAE